jgi:hypothetical protein
MLNVNGMRPPFQILIVFLLYGDDVLYYYSQFGLLNEYYLLKYVLHP